MGKINWGRVVLGGLLAWIVVVVFNAIYIPMFAETWSAAMESAGTSPIEPTAAFLVAFVVLTLGGSVGAVWLYAGLRPRYGPGPKTAALAGFFLWLMWSFGMYSFWGHTAATFGQFTTIQGPYLLCWIVAAMAGAWIYREGEAEAQAAPATPKPPVG